jgi:hypothetical protein
MAPTDSTSPEEDQTTGLKLVDDSADSEASSETSRSNSETGSSDRRSKRRSLPVWLFVVALIVFALVIGRQAQLASELEGEVAGLEVQLEHTNALLDARRTHLSEVREGVHELSERLQGLRGLVDRDPTAGVPEAELATP